MVTAVLTGLQLERIASRDGPRICPLRLQVLSYFLRAGTPRV